MTDIDDRSGDGDLMEFLSEFRSPPPTVVAPEGLARPNPAPTRQPPPVVVSRPPETYVPPVPRPARSRPRVVRQPLTRERIVDLLLNPQENPLATTALCLGLASLVIPLLALPSCALAVVNLRRSATRPWVQGRARSLGAIIASVTLTPISLAIWMPLLLGS